MADDPRVVLNRMLLHCYVLAYLFIFTAMVLAYVLAQWRNV